MSGYHITGSNSQTHWQWGQRIEAGIHITNKCNMLSLPLKNCMTLKLIISPASDSSPITRIEC